MATLPFPAGQPSPLEAARALVSAGFSVIPIARDGSKHPWFQLLPTVMEGDRPRAVWSPFVKNAPEISQLAAWFGGKRPAGLAVISGAVSGALEGIDFDYDADRCWADWCELLDSHAPGLRERLTVHKSPKGYHVWYRCPEVAIPGGTDIARDPEQGTHGLMIETRGEGNYTLAPGSPLDCNPLKLPYAHLAGPPLAQVVNITSAERELLLDAARSLDRRPFPMPAVDKVVGDAGLKPGQDFNLRGPSWEQLLPAGWKLLRHRGQVELWQRPDKDGNGHSATIGFRRCPLGTPQIFCFSANAAPVPAGRFLDKFGLYAILNHGGDFKAAARQLGKEGYGGKPTKKQDGKEPKKNNSAQLIDMVLALKPELFHTPDRDTYATFEVNDHLETFHLRAGEFETWLSGRYWQAARVSAGEKAVKDTITTLRAMALYDGVTQQVFCRVGRHEGRQYIDLGNPLWNAVEIDATGWRIVARPPVRFRRANGMLPICEPQHGGNLELLRGFLNFDTEQGWLLTLAFLTACLAPLPNFPLLVVQGEQGSAKSTFGKVCKALIDPNEGELLPDPKDPETLTLQARDNPLYALDNLSHIDQWFSDALCRLATGAGNVRRRLHTTDETWICRLTRPVLLNGITDFVASADLLERCLRVRLKSIDPKNRREDEEFWTAFRAAQPLILGALYDAVSHGLRLTSGVRLQEKPRMADFARWGEAVWRGQELPPGYFVAEFFDNQAEANADLLDNNALAGALIAWLSEVGRVEGTPTDVLRRLDIRVGERVAGQRGWPRAPQSLNRQLQRLTPLLRSAGIVWSSGKRPSSGSSRFLLIEKRDSEAPPATPTPENFPNT